MKTQVVCSAATADELQTMINKYFYSTAYRIKENKVFHERKQTFLNGYIVREKNGRFQFCREV